MRGGKSAGNTPIDLYFRIIQVSPRYKFYVQEIAAAIRGEKIDLDDYLRGLGCQIGIVTNIGTDHLKAFGSIESIAAAKAKLVTGLPGHGTAILNADDSRVLEMASQCRAKIMTVGVENTADIKAIDITSVWPDPLTFTVVYGESRASVRTQLYGEFWVHSVLAAIAVGLEMGLSLSQAITAVEDVQPYPRRMEPMVRNDGVIFMRDDHKAPINSIPVVLDTLAKARARRRIAIIGSISDYYGNSDRTYRSVARRALSVADWVIFVGPWSHKCLAVGKEFPDRLLDAFMNVDEAKKRLAGRLTSGDFILLKGTQKDQLGRLVDC
jgi:UDP-N-acetylmuramyl pentapeptide synthase